MAFHKFITYFISCLIHYAAVVVRLKRSLDVDDNASNSNDVDTGEEAPISDALAQVLKTVRGIVRTYTGEEKSTVIKVYKTVWGELELAQRTATLHHDVRMYVSADDLCTIKQ